VNKKTGPYVTSEKKKSRGRLWSGGRRTYDPVEGRWVTRGWRSTVGVTAKRERQKLSHR